MSLVVVALNPLWANSCAAASTILTSVTLLPADLWPILDWSLAAFMVRPTSGDTIKVGGVYLYHEAAHDAGNREYHAVVILVAQNNPHSAGKGALMDNYPGPCNQVGMRLAIVQLQTLAQGLDLDIRQG